MRRNSAPANVDECKDVNLNSNSDVSTNASTNANAEVDIGDVVNASTLAKEPVDTNEKTMGDLHAGIDISMDKNHYFVRSMGQFEKFGINPHELPWKWTFLSAHKVKEIEAYGIPNVQRFLYGDSSILADGGDGHYFAPPGIELTDVHEVFFFSDGAN